MKRTLAAVWLFVLSAQGPAGMLSAPTTHGDVSLAPIPAQRLDELDAASIERIQDTHAQLDAALATTDTGKERLAALYGRLGALYAAHRLFAGAELALGNARALDPNGFQWAYYAAHIALEQGEPEQALALLGEASRIDPGYPPLAMRRGEALLGLNRLGEARAAYMQALGDDGLRAAALYGLGQIDLLERDWTGAAAKLGEVVARQPQADAVHYPLAQALLGLGERDAARAHLAQRGTRKPGYEDTLVKELHSLQAGARFHFEQGVAAVKRQDYAAAARSFAAGLAGEPANVRARTSYARALWLSGQHGFARAELERATADGPAETLPRFLLAVLDDAAGAHDSADAGYRAVLAIDPQHEGAMSYLANLALRRGDNAAASMLFEQAVTAGVTQMPLFLHYWGALLHAGRDETLLRDKLLEFDRRFPEPPVFRYLLARLLATANDAAVRDTASAVDLATRLNEAQPLPPHTELLALALAAHGDFAAAAQHVERLIEVARFGGAWVQAATLERTLEDYRAERVPAADWTTLAAMLIPAPADPESAMRNYPAGRPY